MNKKPLFAISFFLGGTFFLGYGYSLLMGMVGKDAWISLLIGVFLGIGVIYLLEQIKKKEQSGIEKYKMMNRIIFFFFNLFLFGQILFIFQTFASSFFLIKSANWFITLPIPFIIYKIAKSGFSTIGKISEILVPIALFLLVFAFVGLFEHFKLDSFTPIFTSSIDKILQGALLVMTYSTMPYFLLLKVNLKTPKLIKGYLASELAVILIAIFIIAVLGPNLIGIYRYPEYMILKEIKLFDFIEKVENIVCVAWLFNLFVFLSLSGYNLKECLPKKKNNLYFIVLLGIMYIVAILESYFYPQELALYHILPYVFLGIEILLILTSFLSYRKKRLK